MPNPSLEGTRTGMALGPRVALRYIVCLAGQVPYRREPRQLKR